MASSWIQVGGSALSGGKAEKVGRVRCRRAGNVPVVLCRVVFMRLFSAGGRKPWGRVDISRMSPLASTGQCKWRTGVGVRRTSKDKVHFTFRGEVRWQLPLSRGPSPQQLWPQERSHGWRNLQKFTDFMMPASNLLSHSQEVCWQMVVGSLGVP